MRDLFGSISYILQRKVDIAQVLRHPLTPVPLSFSHVDGTMLRTSKSAVLTYLEIKRAVTTRDEIDVQIMDTAFFLPIHKDLPANFAGIAKDLLRKILQRVGKVIHLVSDKWITPSVKVCERQSRNETDVNYHIIAAAQKRPANWLGALCSSSFKTSLVEFLVLAWSSRDYASLFEGKILFPNCGNICYKFVSILGKVVRTEERSWLCTHDEADIRTFFHFLPLENQSNFVIRTASNGWRLGYRVEITCDLSMLILIYSNLGKNFCKALPPKEVRKRCTSSNCLWVFRTTRWWSEQRFYRSWKIYMQNVR